MMGRNIDMIKMFGDFDVTCPRCNHTTKASSTFLDDIDVDGSNFNPENGVWEVDMWCYGNCDKEFPLKLKITAEQVCGSTPTANDLDLSEISLDPHGSSDDKPIYRSSTPKVKTE